MRPLRSPSRHGALPKLAVLLSLFSRTAVAAVRINTPTNENFLRTGFNAVTVIENWLYIDGGEISQKVDGKATASPMNATLAIDLTSSWFSSDVVIHEIKRPQNKADGPPPMDLGAVWNDPSGQSFYVWGGIAPYGQGINQTTKEGIWKFTPNANDRSTGTWSLETPSTPQVLANLNLGFQGGFVATNTTGYWLGGYVDTKTDPSMRPGQDGPTSGLVSYNMATKEWKNETATDLIPDGNSRGAEGLWLPRFGKNGLVSFIGGMTKTDVSEGGQDFTNITFFDPLTRQSWWQKTTGEAPTPRKDFCSVTVESPRGGYDVFVFGGGHPFDGKSDTYDDVYLLSLPGFQWFKAEKTLGKKRSGHSCVVAGQRQMISIGGTTSNNFNNAPSSWDDADEFNRGIGVFDMTAFAWVATGKFNALASAYESPQVVNEWYTDAGDLSQRDWSSDEVKALFITEDTTKPVDSNSENTNSDSESESSDSDSGSSTGAIAGGVVGGVAGIALIAGLVWFFIRRKNRAAAAGDQSAAENQPLGQSPLPQHQYYRGHYSPQQPMQQPHGTSLDAAKYYVPTQAQEMPATYSMASELPSNNDGTRWELDSTPTGPSTAR